MYFFEALVRLSQTVSIATTKESEKAISLTSEQDYLVSCLIICLSGAFRRVEEAYVEAF